MLMMNEKIENLSWEIENLKKNQMEILKWKNTIPEDIWNEVTGWTYQYNDDDRIKRELKENNTNLSNLKNREKPTGITEIGEIKSFKTFEEKIAEDSQIWWKTLIYIFKELSESQAGYVWKKVCLGTPQKNCWQLNIKRNSLNLLQ